MFAACCSRVGDGDWLITRIKRRLPGPGVDALLLRPFGSKQAAINAVGKFASLLPDKGRPLSENYPGDWSMGMYLITGVRTG